MDKEMWLITVGGILLIVRDLISKLGWSLLLYFFREEFDQDKNDDTPSKFLLLNPYLGTFEKCYITQYTILGVRWGFFYEDGYVAKFSFWLAWVEDRKLRFPMPIKIDNEDHDRIVNLIKKR